MAEPQLIKSLDKGLRILEIIGNSDTPVSISELSRMLNMNRSSIFRLLNTLKARGYVINPANSKSFVLGSAIRTLSNKTHWLNTLVQIARKYLIELAFLTGETAHIGVLDGKQTLIVDNEMSPQSIGVTVKTGDTGLIHCTSVGKALVLEYKRNELIGLLGENGYETLTPYTITDVDTLYRELQGAKSAGYVIDNEEYNLGVRCIGVPIKDISGQIVAALAISSPINRLPESKFKDVGLKVLNIGEKINLELGVKEKELANI